MKIPAALFNWMGLSSLLTRYHKARLLAAIDGMRRLGTETTMPTRRSDRFRHHQAALRSLGFLVQREFELLQRPIVGTHNYRAFCQALRQRFPDPFWSCACRGARVVVIAPYAQMAQWQRFLLEYDRGA